MLLFLVLEFALVVLGMVSGVAGNWIKRPSWARTSRIVTILIVVAIGVTAITYFMQAGTPNAAEKPSFSQPVPTYVTPTTTLPSPTDTSIATLPPSHLESTLSAAPETAAPNTRQRDVPKRSGSVTLNVELTRSGKIGPTTYSNPMAFSWQSQAYDDSGELRSGCYVHWILSQGASTVGEWNVACQAVMASNLRKLGPGNYHFAGTAATDWNATGSKSIDFEVVNG